MNSNRVTYLGIDPTLSRMTPAPIRRRKAQHAYLYAALDQDLNLVALSEGDIEALTAFLAGQSAVVVAVNAPSRPNQGVMGCAETRASLAPAPKAGHWQNLRMVEYQLRQHHIPAVATPCQEGDCPRWMQAGFEVYRRLQCLGYQPYPNNCAPRQWLEVNPQASACALLGLAPFSRDSLEGRLQRQLLLNDRGVDVPDPMDFFEEVTPHKLLKGVLPMKNIYSPCELDALIAAYTAWFAAARSEEVSILGYADEGQVVVPVKELLEKY